MSEMSNILGLINTMLCDNCRKDNDLRNGRGEDAILCLQPNLECCVARRFKELEDELHKLKLRIELVEPGWK